MTALRSDADELTTLLAARASALAALLALTRMEVVAWYQARAVYLAIVETFLGVSVRAETERHIIDGIQGSESPLLALAVFCDTTIRCWGRDTPAIVEPLRRLAAKLDPERAGRRSMLDADEPPSCLAGGVTTRADVAPREPGPCPVCSGPQQRTADAIVSDGGEERIRYGVAYCPTCAGDGRPVAPVAEVAATAGASS